MSEGAGKGITGTQSILSHDSGLSQHGQMLKLPRGKVGSTAPSIVSTGIAKLDVGLQKMHNTLRKLP